MSIRRKIAKNPLPPSIEVIGTVGEENRQFESSRIVERKGLKLNLDRYKKSAKRGGVAVAAVAVLAVPGSSIELPTPEQKSPTTAFSQEELNAMHDDKMSADATLVQNNLQERARSCAELSFFWGTVEISNVATQAPPTKILNPVVYDRQHIGFEPTTEANDTRPYAVVRIIGGSPSPYAVEQGTAFIPAVSLVDKSPDQIMHFKNHAGENYIARNYETEAAEALRDDIITSEVCIKYDQAGNVVSLQTELDTTAVALDISVGSPYAHYGA